LQIGLVVVDRSFIAALHLRIVPFGEAISRVWRRDYTNLAHQRRREIARLSYDTLPVSWLSSTARASSSSRTRWV